MAQDPDRIREQIAETRERLGETTEALAYRMDLRSRARERAASLAGSLRSRTGGLARSTRGRIPSGVRGRLPAATAGAAAVGILAGLLIPLRRARRRRW